MLSNVCKIRSRIRRLETQKLIKMSDVGDEPVGTFAIHFAEGECLAKQGQYIKAIESYTTV